MQDVLDPSFDPASYLNAALPPLSRRTGAVSAGQTSTLADAASLTELSTQAQILLTQLNVHTTRLSNTLTVLADDILRSGSRLAYKVELLRGETLSLTETLHETLQDDIRTFIPEGLPAASGTGGGEAVALDGSDSMQREPEKSSAEAEVEAEAEGSMQGKPQDPEFIQKLQTFTLVKTRLESVIKVFGDAMEFTFPPSEVSVGSGFLSVSAPDPGSEQQSSEQKGQQVLQDLRGEISGLLTKTPDPVEGIEKAAARIGELKELTAVWNGTAEERGRNKFIDSLAKMVEDRHRELTREMEQAAKKQVRSHASDAQTAAAKKMGVSRESAAAADDSRSLPGGFGLITQLQKLRSGLN